ncbi:MAG: nucleoside triphosphate pyrophosphohydrolase family protein [Candidatus Paceibacterota bacterium]
MKKQLDLVKEFHKKFKVPVLDEPSLIPRDRLSFRHELMKGEVDEYLTGARSDNLENIAKELADVLFAVYGTILEHGLQDKIEDIFEEVYKSNMSKDYHRYKMVKGPDYFPADIKKFLDK